MDDKKIQILNMRKAKIQKNRVNLFVTYIKDLYNQKIAAAKTKKEKRPIKKRIFISFNYFQPKFNFKFPPINLIEWKKIQRRGNLPFYQQSESIKLVLKVTSKYSQCQLEQQNLCLQKTNKLDSWAVVFHGYQFQLKGENNKRNDYWVVDPKFIRPYAIILTRNSVKQKYPLPSVQFGECFQYLKYKNQLNQWYKNGKKQIKNQIQVKPKRQCRICLLLANFYGYFILLFQIFQLMLIIDLFICQRSMGIFIQWDLAKSQKRAQQNKAQIYSYRSTL